MQLVERLGQKEKKRPVAFYYAVAATVSLLVCNTLIGYYNQNRRQNQLVVKEYTKEQSNDNAGQAQNAAPATTPQPVNAIAALANPRGGNPVAQPITTIAQSLHEGTLPASRPKSPKVLALVKRAVPGRYKPRYSPNYTLPAPMMVPGKEPDCNFTTDMQQTNAVAVTQATSETKPNLEDETALLEEEGMDNLLSGNISITIKPDKQLKPLEPETQKSKIQKLGRFFKIAGQVAKGDLSAGGALAQEGIALEFRNPLHQ